MATLKRSGLFAGQAELLQKRSQFFQFISALVGLIAVCLPLVPVPVQIVPGKRVLYNLLGVLNQLVGGENTREDAAALLLVYYAGAVLTAVGCVCVYHKLKTSSLFICGGSALLIIFTAVWAGTVIFAQNPASSAFSNSLMPFILILFAGCAFIAAVIALYLGVIPEKKQ